MGLLADDEERGRSLVRAGGHGLERVLVGEPPEALPEALAARFDAWLEATLRRHAPLSFTDVRKGVQSLSRRYVELREPGDVLASPARRAAFVTYYAGLHLLTAHGVARTLPRAFGDGLARIVDLGAGSGAAAAGVSLGLGLASAPRLLALERSPFALAEARLLWQAFGLAGETQRALLPRGIPRLGPGDLALAGWFLNECGTDEREAVLRALEAGLGAGARVLILEPLSGRVTPWWDAAELRLGARGVVGGSVRWRATLPDWISRMDRAAGLDHAELGARVALGRHA
jgi:hypothetical protein